MLVLRGFFGRQRLDRQGVYLATHELPERTVDELVAREALQLRELARDDVRGKMGVVIRLHAHLCSGEACADQPRDVFSVHWCDITAPGRQALSPPEIRLIGLAQIDSVNLPGEIHADPTDRFFIATARNRRATLVTHDDKIIAFGQSGHVRVLAI
jgi:hypothetical protein